MNDPITTSNQALKATHRLQMNNFLRLGKLGEIAEIIDKETNLPSLLAQRDALREALRAIAAMLNQPVQHTKIRNGASCDVLRGDCVSACQTARKALKASKKVDRT